LKKISVPYEERPLDLIPLRNSSRKGSYSVIRWEGGGAVSGERERLLVGRKETLSRCEGLRRFSLALLGEEKKMDLPISWDALEITPNWLRGYLKKKNPYFLQGEKIMIYFTREKG